MHLMGTHAQTHTTLRPGLSLPSLVLARSSGKELHGMPQRHAISQEFSGHCQDLSFKGHGSACVFILAWCEERGSRIRTLGLQKGAFITGLSNNHYYSRFDTVLCIESVVRVTCHFRTLQPMKNGSTPFIVACYCGHHQLAKVRQPLYNDIVMISPCTMSCTVDFSVRSLHFYVLPTHF